MFTPLKENFRLVEECVLGSDGVWFSGSGSLVLVFKKEGTNLRHLAKYLRKFIDAGIIDVESMIFGDFKDFSDFSFLDSSSEFWFDSNDLFFFFFKTFDSFCKFLNCFFFNKNINQIFLSLLYVLIPYYIEGRIYFHIIDFFSTFLFSKLELSDQKTLNIVSNSYSKELKYFRFRNNLLEPSVLVFRELHFVFGRLFRIFYLFFLNKSKNF